MTNDYSIPEYQDNDDYGQESYANDILQEWRLKTEEVQELENLLQCGFIPNED